MSTSTERAEQCDKISLVGFFPLEFPKSAEKNLCNVSRENEVRFEKGGGLIETEMEVEKS